MTRLRRRDDRGAVAVMVAVLSLALMCVAALTVDLGQAWARGRSVQRQVDVSAMGAGSLLPMSSSDSRTDNEAGDIAARAAELLNQNDVGGQSVVTGADLLDADLGNGNLEFLDNTGAACSDNCVRMSLTAPDSHVSFGFARAFGRDGADVRRSATVGVFSSLPPKDKLVPLWLPSGCGYGPVDGDTTGGTATQTITPSPTTTSPATTAPTSTGTATSTATGSPTATTTTTAPSNQVAIAPIGTHSLGGTSAYALSYGGSTLVKNLSITGVGNDTKKASIRAISPDGTFYNEYASADIKKSSGTFIVADFTIGTELSLTSGTWRLYAVIEKNNSIAYSSNFFTVDVAAGPSAPAASTSGATSSASASPTSIPVGCVGQSRGNFGQLESPRLDGTTGKTRLALNFARGLDHILVPYDFDQEQPVKSCEDGTLADAQLDNVSRPGNNCIKGDPGNDGPGIYDGLISGSASTPGRLSVANGATRCPAAPGTRSDAQVGSTMINNEVLSCYLKDNASLTGLASDAATSDMLDPSIIDSPRFVWLPVVVATDRAQKDFQPILDYVPGFITDETQATAATSDNGLEIAGNSVKVLRLFVFNKAALPPTEQSPETDYDEDIANPVVHLLG